MARWIKRLFKRRPRREGVVVGDGSRISGDTVIGRYTYVGRNCTITRTRIGRYVSIANNVSIGNGEHDIGRVSTSSLFYGDAYSELTKGECVIESDAWIGVDAIIRRGVRIGVGAVVGANSFVNRDVPDYAIAVGSPARIVGHRFDADTRSRLLASRWWELEETAAREVVSELERSLLQLQAG